MKKTIISIVLVLIFNSCGHVQKRVPAQDSSPSLHALSVDPNMGIEIEEFQDLVEESLVWRAKAIEFAENRMKTLKKDVLSHAEMLALYDSAKKYLTLRQKILEHAYRYQELVDTYSVVTLNEGKGTHERLEKIFEDGRPGSALRVLFVDPLDENGRKLLVRMKISLAAALVLYDNYLIGIYPYQKQKKVRNLLNKDLPGTQRELEKITENFFNLENRNKLIRAVNLFNKDIEIKKQKNLTTEKEEMYLEAFTLQSPFYQYIVDGNHREIDPKSFRAFFDQFIDRVRFIRDSFSFITSKVFGNSVGLIASREGKLKKLSSKEKEDIVKQMRPLDIMLEKTPFRLTDRFIPGYYGHVAIWAGDENDLKNLGIWDAPEVRPYQQQIREGRRIIEALRPGVQINTLDHFLDIDDLLVLRDKNLTEEMKKEFLLRAFSQVGKDYDFNFDVETDKRIVCSEIVYVVFHDINWPTKKSLGRYTISPDNVVEKALGGDPLEPILMYKSGVMQTGDFVQILQDLTGK